MTTIRSCAIVGAGTAARALAPRFRDAGIPVLSVSSRSTERAKALADAVDARPVPISDFDDRADLIVLAVVDAAIAEVCARLVLGRDLSSRSVVHLAGAVGLEPLEPARQAGAAVGKLHPLASLAGGPQRLNRIAWGVHADDPLRHKLVELVERLDGLPLDLASVDAGLYHLSAVFASNFLLALLDVAVQLWQRSGAPAPPAEALLPLVRTALGNWDDLGIEDALTGPIVRADPVAVAHQLQLILEAFPGLEGLYRELALATLDIAERRRPEDRDLAHIGRFLAKKEMID